MRELDIFQFFRCEELEMSTKSLVNLKPLGVCILPFIRSLVQLREIFSSIPDDYLDLTMLNKERTKLAVAQKLIIYINEESFLATKLANKNTNFGLLGM